MADDDDGHPRKIKYLLRPEFGDFGDAEVKDWLSMHGSSAGVCDAFILNSICWEGDAREEYIVSFDGRTHGTVSKAEFFRSWVIQADMLSRSFELGPDKRAICKNVIELCLGKWP